MPEPMAWVILRDDSHCTHTRCVKVAHFFVTNRQGTKLGPFCKEHAQQAVDLTLEYAAVLRRGASHV